MPTNKQLSDTDTLLRFVRAFMDMRKAQRTYFKSRQAEHLEDSKRREKELDTWAEEILGLTTPNLFDQVPETEAAK